MLRTLWDTASRYGWQYGVRIGMVLALTAAMACGDSETAAPAPLPAPVATVDVAPTHVSIFEGGVVALVATPRDASNRPLERAVTWSSSNADIATVAANGAVTGLAAGQVTITATSEGKQGAAVVDVARIPVAEVRLSADDEVPLPWNGTTQLTATAFDAQGRALPGRAVTWQSSRPAVVTVAADGILQARGQGTANVTATIEGKVATVGVRVAPVPVKTITIDADLDGMEPGETAFAGVALVGENDLPIQRIVTWSSSAPAIATVEANNPMLAAVQALGAGRVTITATVDGKNASYTFTVAPRPAFDLLYARTPANATTSELYTLALDGSNAAPVRLNAGNVSRDPSPSPDGGRLVFAVGQVNPTTGMPQHDLYVVRRDGLGMQRLTSDDGYETQPQWSPDGTLILFRIAANDVERANLAVIRPDGTGRRILTAGIPATMTDISSPVWSQDGARIAFIGAVNGQHKVWVMNADGSNAHQVTTDAGFDSDPTWSPDGTTIAFTRWNTATPDTHGEDLMLVDVASGAVQRLALPGDQRAPAWAPDGQHIAFSGTTLAGRGVANLYTMRPDGTGVRLRTVNPAWSGAYAPAWIRR